MPQTVQLPNGEIHTFPDGASKDQIQSALDSYKSTNPSSFELPKPPKSTFNQYRDTAIDFARPFIDEAAMGAGATLGGPLAPLTGGAAYMGSDYLLQHLRSEPERGLLSQATGQSAGSLSSDLMNTLEQVGFGKLIGKGVTAVGNAYNEFTKPGSVVGDAIAKLKPSVSGYLSGWRQTLAHGVENIEPISKSAQIKGSGQAGYDEFMNYAKNLSGRAQSVLSDPQVMANKIELEGARNQYDLLNNSLDNNKTVTSLHARSNPNPILQGFDLNSKQPLLENRPGPINLPSVTNEINDFMQSLQGKNLTEPDKQAIALIQKVKSATDPRDFIDPDKPLYQTTRNPISGQVSQQLVGFGKTSTGPRPLSYDDASDWRGILKNLTEDPRTKKLLLSNGDQFSEFASKLKSSLDDDIEGSISQWKNKPNEALQAFHNQQFLEKAQEQIFDKEGLSKLLDDPDLNPMTKVSAMLQDYQQVQRAVAAGKLQIPTSKGSMVLKSSNIQNDLKGYRLMQVLSENSSLDPATGKMTITNAGNLYNSFNDPSYKATHDVLFSKAEQSNINDFLRNLSQVTTPPSVANRFIYGHGSTIGLLSSLISGNMHGYQGILIGGKGLATLMNNPTTARIMVAAAKGAPLGISQQLAGQTIRKVLTGLTVHALSQDQSEVPMTMTPDGLQPIQ